MDEPGTITPYACLLLVLLFLAYVLSVIDRFLLSLLVEPIQRDLELSDAAFGLLHGFAFVLLYAIAGLPIGRLVDRGERTSLIAAGMAGWSLMTVACGLASRYWQLFVARIGVGIGEAVLSPAGYSIIADTFPRRRLSLANGIFFLGAVWGGGLAFIFGAYVFALAEARGTIVLPIVGTLAPWQQTLVLFGLPGLPLAWIWMRIREPARLLGNSSAAAPELRDVAGFVRTSRLWLLPLLIGVGATAMVNATIPSWIVAFLGRVHGLNMHDAGVWSGAAAIAGPTMGMIVGGIMGDRIGARHSHRRLWAAAAAMSLCALASMTLVFTPAAALAIVSYGGALMTAGPATSLAMASLQENTPGRMRGVAAALFMIAVNLIGAGIGPLLAGAISDGFSGPTSIRTGVGAVAIGASLLSSGLLSISARQLERVHRCN